MKDTDVLCLITPFDIRWLSHFKSIKRILELYPAIIAAMEEIYTETKNIIIKANLKEFKKLKTLICLCLYLDALDPVDKLTK